MSAETSDVWDEGPPPSSPFHPDTMPIGWPRPTSAWGGERPMPIPYIASGTAAHPDLGAVDAMRQALCVTDHRCQVCGRPLGDTCVVVAGPHNVLVIDGAGICPTPCWPVARRRCPALAAMLDVGALRVWTIATDQLVVYDGEGEYAAGYMVPDVPADGC